ncbi:integrin alpha-4 [Polypterus senegalus]
MELRKFGEVWGCGGIWRLACLCCLLRYSRCYNVDVKHSVNFHGPHGSLFGYSLLLHRHDTGKWVLVGAPLANSTFNASIMNPGAIYKCSLTDISGSCEQLPFGSGREPTCGKTCQAERDNQWLGVSLSGRLTEDGHILACGHRWKNIFYTQRENHKLPHGVCYRLRSDLTQMGGPLIPCYKDYHRKFGENYGSCQAGMSSFLFEDLMVIGAPGSNYWTGSVMVYKTSNNSLKAYNDYDNMVTYGSYLGYSVSAGHFMSPTSTEVVGGAPQYGQTGKVYIFGVSASSQLRIITQLNGKLLGSYYGASLCAADLNADGLTDLLVGAPMFSTVREEGRVYVYLNRGDAKMEELEFTLMGSNSYSARFGETITDLGDIDNDGFTDLAVGAPQEDDLTGAVYIYNGRKKGISRSFSQRITGETLGHPFKMFGQSVAGGVDVDDNGYPDMVVGAFLSDAAVVLRTRAIVIVDASVHLPATVNRTRPECMENRQPAVCINITVCFMVQAKGVPGHVGLLYNVTSDVLRKKDLPFRFYFLGNGTSNSTTGSIHVQHNRLTCVTHQAFMRKEVRDIFSPIHFEVSYQLGEHIVKSQNAKHFPPLMPILQQREGQDHRLMNQTMFARYCVWENCSANLQVYAEFALPQSTAGKRYFAIGSGKTVTLSMSLFNAGDDAYQTTIHVSLPKSLHFIKVLESEEKHISCDFHQEEQLLNKLKCSVGHLYINSLSQTNFALLLDVDKHVTPEDLHITVNATCECAENTNLLHDNLATAVLPLRYEVDLGAHGFVSPSFFTFGPSKQVVDSCFTETFNYTFTMTNFGPSRASNTMLELSIPNSVAMQPFQLVNIVDLKTSQGECLLPKQEQNCEVQDPFDSLTDVVFFFSKTNKRLLYCMHEDTTCLNVTCNLGSMESGAVATIHLILELNPIVLAIARNSIVQIMTTSRAFPEPDPYVVHVQRDHLAQVLVEAHHDGIPKERVRIFLLLSGLVMGFLLLFMLIYTLWKVGFFKRSFKKQEEQQQLRRESWDYVTKSKDVY